MKIGDYVCGDSKCKCNFCPFNTLKGLIICTGFKLNQTLFEGLELNKNKLSYYKYQDYLEALNEEV